MRGMFETSASVSGYMHPSTAFCATGTLCLHVTDASTPSYGSCVLQEGLGYF